MLKQGADCPVVAMMQVQCLLSKGDGLSSYHVEEQLKELG